MIKFQNIYFLNKYDLDKLRNIANNKKQIN